MDITGAEAVRQSERLDGEQRLALELIVSGACLDDVLGSLTSAFARLDSGVTACIVEPNAKRTAVGAVHTAYVPEEFSTALQGAPIGEALVGTCGSAIQSGKPVVCDDIATPSLPSWSRTRDSRSRTICAAPSSRVNCNCITSRRSTPAPAGSRKWRRWPAGTTRAEVG